MDYWAKPGLDRQQAMLFYPTLDQSISDNHPVRHLDEILRGLDWSAWEQEYDGHRGQPPIPPWVMAGVILYRLMRRIRFSRQLEYACANNVDFLWLAEGRTIDHDTLCKFRVRFKEPLKQLFKQVGRLAMTMGLIRLVEVAFDGTRVKANASRLHTWTAERVEGALRELPAGQGVSGPQGQTRADDHSRRTRAGEGEDVCQDADGGGEEDLQPADAHRRDAVCNHQGHTRCASLLAARLGEEWRWVCTAYNLKKLTAALAALRAEGEAMAVAPRG